MSLNKPNILEKRLTEGVNFFQSTTEKYQIILGDTNRPYDEYVKSLENRRNGKYDRYPTFLITRDGNIIQFYDPKKHYSNFMGNEAIDKIAIVILFENYGALRSYSDVPLYRDQFDRDIKRKVDICQKEWRNEDTWENYKLDQYRSGGYLIKSLIKEFNISPILKGHNVYDALSIKFKGILTRSNYFLQYLDVNPSFDFELLKIEINDYDNNK